MKNYLSLVKFSHTIFALPFALIGYFLATQTDVDVHWNKLVFVVLCMLFARNAAMAFNRFIDRKIDLENPRTATLREIPNGTIKPTSALYFVLFNVVFFILTTYFINRLCFYLSPVALIIILGYSYTKRFTALCHLVLGVGLALAPIGAYLSVTGSFAWLPLFFSFAVLFWVSGFDIIYALQDESFDKQQKLHSIPVLLGREKSLYLSSFLHTVTAAFIIGAGFYASFGIYYWIGAIFFILLLVYQHIIIKPTDLSKVNLAFFTTNGIASLVFATFTILDLFFN